MRGLQLLLPKATSSSATACSVRGLADAVCTVMNAAVALDSSSSANGLDTCCPSPRAPPQQQQQQQQRRQAWPLLPQGDYLTKSPTSSLLQSHMHPHPHPHRQLTALRGVATSTFKQLARRFRVNNHISAPQLLVVFPDGSNEVLSRDEALEAARTRSLDLVEVAAEANPPVARILDFKAYLHEQQTAEAESKKSARLQAKLDVPKEIHLSPKIADNDLHTKLRKAEGFLAEGLKVTLVVEFKDDAAAEQAGQVLDSVAQRLADRTVVGKPKERQRRSWLMTLRPKGQPGAAKQQQRKPADA